MKHRFAYIAGIVGVLAFGACLAASFDWITVGGLLISVALIALADGKWRK